MRVLILNVVALNGGDAAILLAVREHVRRACGEDAEVVVMDVQHEAAGRHYPELRFSAPLLCALLRYPKVRWLGRVIRDLNRGRWLLAARERRLSAFILRPRERQKLAEYASADLAISTGGTYLVERYSPWLRLTELRIVGALGVPLILYTQSIGRMRRRESVRNLRAVAAAADAVLLRDGRSHSHLAEVGASTDAAHVLADAVFTFAQREIAAPSTPKRVGFAVRDWPYVRRAGGQQGYVDALRRLVEHLVRTHDTEVTFLSTCQGVPEYWTDDSAFARTVVSGLDDDVAANVEVDRRFHRPEQLVERFAEFDVVVSARMHGAILALCAGTPVLPIAYEFKTDELFARLGMGAYVTDVEDVDGTQLVATFERFWAERADWLPGLKEAVAAERESADRALEHLTAALR